jgi:hypothetical protein
MSDYAQAPRRKPDATFVVAGLASSLLFLSVFLSFAFLVPIQIVFGRRGGRSGMAAVGISAAGIVLAQTTRFAAAGGFAQGSPGGMSGFPALGAGLLPPIVLLLALALVNASFERRWNPAYRLMGATLVCSLLALPLLISVGKDASIAAFLEGRIGAILNPLRRAAAESTEGYEASALAASLDPKDIVATSYALLRDSFVVIIYGLLAGSWWLGGRMSGLGSRGRKEAVAIDELRLPYPFLWAFLASWSFVLATELLKAPVAASAFAWNCALAISLAYAAAGLGIVTYLLKSWNAPRSLRICLAVIAVLALATPIGIVVAASLPLIGVTEIWIHYRKPKGVGA